MEADSKFIDRWDAARQLAGRLQHYRGRKPLVLAIPRGGVPLGVELARQLDGELDLLLVHKISMPSDPECAIGAIDETGWRYLCIPYEGLPAGLMDEQLAATQALLKRRRRRYAPYLRVTDARQRCVIVVDDGAATGATMVAAIHAARRLQPARLICALPVAPAVTVQQLASLADEVVCLRTPPDGRAVGYYYRHFDQVSDDEVVRLLHALTR